MEKTDKQDKSKSSKSGTEPIESFFRSGQQNGDKGTPKSSSCTRNRSPSIPQDEMKAQKKSVRPAKRRKAPTMVRTTTTETNPTAAKRRRITIINRLDVDQANGCVFIQSYV